MAGQFQRYQQQVQVRSAGDLALARPLPAVNAAATVAARQAQGLGEDAVRLGEAGLHLYGQVEAARATQASLAYQRDLMEWAEQYRADNKGEKALNAGQAFGEYAERRAREVAGGMGGGWAPGVAPAKPDTLRLLMRG
jgi:hypothetical protein